MIREAVQTAKEADQVLLFVGSFLPGEDDDYNRKDIKLSEGMTRLIDAVSAVNKNCIVILSSGEVCEMPWRHQVSAVLLTWFSGEGMGSAIADILFGKVSPSGRLANTVPERLQDTPAYLSFDGNVYVMYMKFHMRKISMSDIAIMKRRVFSQPILSDMVCHIHHLNMNIWRSAKRMTIQS